MVPLQTRVDLGLMAMKEYSPKVPALLELYHHVVKCHIQDTHWGGILLLYREAVSVLYSPSRQGKINFESHFLYPDISITYTIKVMVIFKNILS